MNLIPRTFRPMTYSEAKAHKTELEQAFELASATLKRIPGIGSGLMGLTPDSFKALPEYARAKGELNKAFASLQAFNMSYVKQYKRELAGERKARDLVRQGGRTN